MGENRKNTIKVESLGKRLRQARERLSLSQEDLAEKIGNSSRSIRRWEHDKAIPQLYYQEKLCRVFNMSLEALFAVHEERDDDKKAAPFPIWNVP